MKTLIILNPVAAGGKALEKKDEIEAKLKENKIDYRLHISKSSDDIIEVTKKNLANGFSNFVGVGGDGTIHYIANALAGTDKNLGVIPTGSGNDIAGNLNIPSEIGKCCQIIKKAATKKIDLGLINNKYYYLCIAGSGFDSEVNDLANNTKLPFKGPFKYKYSVYKTLITFKSKKFFIRYNNQKKEDFGMMIAITNLHSYGGGMKIAPDSDPTDGLFDVCIIKIMNKMHFIKIFPKVYEGKHISDPHVELFRTSNIEVDSSHKFSIFADGEYICKLPAVFKIVPGAINFITA